MAPRIALPERAIFPVQRLADCLQNSRRGFGQSGRLSQNARGRIGRCQVPPALLEFSKLRPVFTNPRLSLLHMFYPPYKKRHRQVLDLLIKYKR